MKTITFYSYKGGVGRTLLLANLAKRLAEVGKTVCILDFDLEAPSSSSKFGFAKFGTDAKVGLVDYIYDFQENKKLPESIETTELFTTYADKFYLIKAGDSSNPDYWKKLLKISWNKLFYEQNSQGIEFLLYFKDLIKKQINPDYLLIDTRTGITEIASITISLFADEVVMLSGNNKDSLEGSKQVLKTITNKENIYNDDIPNVYFILSRLPNPNSNPKAKERENHIILQHLSDINQHLIGNNYELKEENLKIIHSDRQLEFEEKLKIGYGLDNEDIISKDYYDIFNLIFRNSLSKEELDSFYNIKKSDSLVQKALELEKRVEEIGFDKSINLLLEAIEKNNENREAYYNLGRIYCHDGNYEEALKFIENALQQDYENYFLALYFKAFTLQSLNNFKDADNIFDILLSFQENNNLNKYTNMAVFNLLNKYYLTKSKELSFEFKELINKYPEESIYYNFYANYLRELGNYEEAINQLNIAFELNFSFAHAYTTLAEINASQNKDAEFYRNFESALNFRIESHMMFQFDVIDIYKKYFEQERFIKLLEKYNYKYAIKRIKKYLGQEVDNDDF